jgi:hypothetical protein
VTLDRHVCRCCRRCLTVSQSTRFRSSCTFFEQMYSPKPTDSVHAMLPASHQFHSSPKNPCILRILACTSLELPSSPPCSTAAKLIRPLSLGRVETMGWVDISFYAEHMCSAYVEFHGTHTKISSQLIVQEQVSSVSDPHWNIFMSS